MTQETASRAQEPDRRAAFARIAPFAAFMICLAADGGVDWLTASGYIPSETGSVARYFLYPARYALSLSVLVWFFRDYEEMAVRPTLSDTVLSSVVGLAVYAIWTRLTWPWAVVGELSDYNPYAGPAAWGSAMAAVRLAGAALVVPLMEELFWRSFLLRWLVRPDFRLVSLGTFTVPSFLIATVLFGLEHNLWLSGIVAGVAYTALLYRSKNLWSCIVAHGVTNLALGVHVLLTQQWHWW